jgi:DNA-binding transcriptional ArsR family regulator
VPVLHDVPIDVHDAERLRQQAKALQTRADRLADERLELLRESWALERDATRIEQAAEAAAAPVRRRQERARRRDQERDAEMLGKVCDLLGQLGPLSTGDIGGHLNLTPARVRAILARLQDVGMVARSGVKRGTRYRLIADEEQATGRDNVREFGNYATAVRDAAIELGTFTIADLQAALPDLSEVTLRRWLAYLVEKGVLIVERVDGRNVWAYEAPEAGPTQRRKREAVEVEVARDAKIAVPERGQAVAGVGAVREGKLVGELLREVRAVAPDVEVKRTAHTYTFRRDGRVISDCSSTPGKASHLGGTRKRLRDAGVMVKP